MGIHYPFGYVGYESTCLHTFIFLIDSFCSGCHTNQDVGSCRQCPVGKLVFKAKEYLLNAYESDICTQEAKILRKIKRAIKRIDPHPLFNNGWIWEEKRSTDELLSLRELLKDLEFVEDERLRDWCLQSQIRRRIRKKVEKEITALKKNGKKKNGG